MRRPLVSVGLIAGLTLLSGAALACDRPAGWRTAAKIDGKTWTAWWQPNPTAIPVGAHFTIRFRLCGPAVRTVKVRGWMPDHRHGMNYRPSVSMNGTAGTAKGLLFHMPGRWRLTFDVAGAGKREKLVTEMVLE